MYSAEYIANKLQERKEKVVFAYLLALQKRKEVDLKCQDTIGGYPFGFGSQLRDYRCSSGDVGYYCQPGELVHELTKGASFILNQICNDVIREYRNTRDALKIVGCFAGEYTNQYANLRFNREPIIPLLQELYKESEELLSVENGDKSSTAWQRFQEKIAELERNGATAGFEPEPLPEQLVNMHTERTVQLQAELIKEREHHRRIVEDMSETFNAQLESLKLNFLEQMKQMQEEMNKLRLATAPIDAHLSTSDSLSETSIQGVKVKQL